MQKPKILIVDNELTHLEAIMDIIEEAGNKNRVMTAFNENKAFEIAEKKIPDLLLFRWPERAKANAPVCE